MPGFYRELAADYHLFFPARQAQLDFLAALAGKPPARLIDVASGTGEYAAALSDMRYEAFGVEIDITMQRIARARHPEIAHRLVQGDMRELLDDVRGPARLVFCIGNSLPHLSGLDELAVALRQMWQITRPEGAVALQVVNFDRVLESAVEIDGSAQFDLPTISATRPDGSRIELERRYEIPQRRAGDEAVEHPQRLIFHSVFHRPEGAVQNSVNLLVITRERLAAALPQGAGVRWHGDFEGADWTPGGPATIAVLSWALHLLRWRRKREGSPMKVLTQHKGDPDGKYSRSTATNGAGYLRSAPGRPAYHLGSPPACRRAPGLPSLRVC